ncbi:hypothetical protein, conserved [Eimeria praecox]|uniref:Transmembrane protein n=1 Tax=Eimeria praecox TaxID=51316 RepID=U6GNH1_9EIME|nr:hypothetical protein, conserved [Eimeria praecox]
MGSPRCRRSSSSRHLLRLQQHLVVLLLYSAASMAASPEDAASLAAVRETHPTDGYSNSNSTTDRILLELSEQFDLAAHSLKPNAEPTVFPPPSPQEKTHWNSRMDVAILCLSLVHRHLKTNIPVLKQMIPDASSKMGMREDDALVTLLHQMWAGCYSNALSLPASASIRDLSSEEAETLLKPHRTPMHFSAQTLVDIDKLIEEFAEGRSASSWHTTDWTDTWWFCILSVACIFCLLFIAGRKAARAYRKRHKGKVGVREKAPLTSPKYL